MACNLGWWDPVGLGSSDARGTGTEGGRQNRETERDPALRGLTQMLFIPFPPVFELVYFFLFFFFFMDGLID